MNGLLECHNTISLSKENIKFIYKNQQKSKKKRTRQLAIFAGASPTIVAVKVLNF